MKIKKLLFLCICLLWTGIVNAYEYVDLGLPSGTLWATENIKANTYLYGWGATTGGTTASTVKSNTPYVTYKKSDGSTSVTAASKYTTSDGLTTLELADDAAYKTWGTGWRMPTKDEFQELIDNCTFTRSGTEVTLTGPNGNTVTFPLGRYTDGDDLYTGMNAAYYWTSSVVPNDTYYRAYCAIFNFINVKTITIDQQDRIYGGYIRPVSTTKATPSVSWTYPTSTPSSPFAGGTGASRDNPYLISTAQQLANLAYLTNTGNSTYCNKYYKLTADIDLGNGAWTPIGNTATYPFKGEFNGDGHTISGLYINNSSSSYAVGLFGYAGNTSNYAQIWNLKVKGSVTGKQYVGAIVGYGNNMEFIQCGNEGCTVKGTTDVGGLAGYYIGSAYMLIADYNKGTVSGTTNVGGFFGTIVSCGGFYGGGYNTGSVSGTTNVGAFFGKTTMSSAISNINTAYYLSTSASKGIGLVSTGVTDGTVSCTSSELSSGMVTYTMNNGFGGSWWQQKIGSDSYPVSTCFYPNQASTTIPSGYQVYCSYTHGGTTATYSNSNSGGHTTAATTSNHKHDDSYTITPTWSGTSSCSIKEVCSVCGKTVTQSATITNAITTAATCTTAGVRTYTAQVTTSGSRVITTTTTASIAATGHSYVYTNSNNGTTHVKKCSTCGTSVTENHTYSNNVCTGCSDVGVTGLTMSATSATLWVNGTKNLTATIAPSNATVKTITWSTSDGNVASVSTSGVVTAKAKGTATITAKSANGKTATCAITVKQQVTSISLSSTSLSLIKGNTSTLTATVTPSTANNTGVTWSSSNEAAATVSSSGVVTAVATGTATITCTAADGYGEKTTCAVTVTNPVTNMSLNKTSSTLWVGNTVTLTPTYTPSDADSRSVTWSTSNSSVASVSTSGVVTAKAKGTATITATSANGKTATCAITVKQQVTSISLSSTSLSITKGNTSTLTATVTPSTANNTGVTWSSSNEAAATVSSSGVVTAVATGTATITCTAADGYGTKTTCAVTVTNPVTSISLNKTSSTLWVGNTVTLTPTYTPSDADSRSVTWSTSNSSVASVSTSGVVTAKAKGTATITATSANGKTATCAITVKQQVTSISLSSTSADIVAGEELTITSTATPSTANNTSINWSTSDSKVATVSGGTITAVGKGTATITATAADGYGTKTTIAVTVIARGDVNGDGTINTADITGDVNFILGESTTGLYEAAADYNNNGAVTTTDAISIVRLALTNTTTISSVKKRIKGLTESTHTLAVDDIAMNSGDVKEVAVKLNDNLDKFTSMQFDVTLPEGVTIQNVSVGNRALNHSAVYNKFEDSSVRVICYSLGNEDFSATDGDVVKLTLKADKTVLDGMYDVNFNDILLVRNDVSTVYSERESVSLTIGDATGVNAIASNNASISTQYANGTLVLTANTDGDALVHNASGSLVYKNHLTAGQTVELNVPKGVYIVNGKKLLFK